MLLRIMKYQTPLTLIAATLLLSVNIVAQDAKSIAAPATVKTVEVTATTKEAEVGQQVKITVMAKDASGSVVNEKPSTYFAGPFDIAAADDDGNVKLFGVGQVTVGAIVGGQAGFSTFMVKAPTVKTIEIAPVKTSTRNRRQRTTRRRHTDLQRRSTHRRSHQLGFG